MRTMVAVNQLASNLPRCINLVLCRSQGECDVDLDLSVNHLTTSAQHVAPDSAEATHERDATHLP